MNNFYGKRFLSALMGALSVLGSPVASAVGGKLGKGNLKGEVESSAGRSKNNGKLGELEADRKVKSIDGLKGVLKEIGGKVVRVSPDGKGGFVAFVKTPRGIVTVTIVSVSLLAIITFLVFNGRKSNKGSEKIIKIDGANENQNKNLGDDKFEDKHDSMFAEEIILCNDDEDDEFKGATGKLLEDLFKGNKEGYDSFVKRLFEGFFYVSDGVFREKFGNCGRDLDKFLRVVFAESTFDEISWQVNGVSGVATVSWALKSSSLVVVRFGSIHFEPLRSVFGYLSKSPFVDLQDNQQASWRDKISAVLFSFWCFVKLGLDVGCGAGEVESRLKEQEIDKLSDTFNIIKSYVGERLKDVNRGYDGQELKKAKS